MTNLARNLNQAIIGEGISPQVPHEEHMGHRREQYVTAAKFAGEIASALYGDDVTGKRRFIDEVAGLDQVESPQEQS